ncbi:unnamed protein product [Amoebophrya sp. A25]|nr:unnamed protein product [Amoebophrya sp. A25]|eukprot:GSA25T00015137001.1
MAQFSFPFELLQRILHESALMNKPLFATAEAQVPANMQHLGHIVDFGAEDVSEEFALFVNALRKNMRGDRPMKFAQQHLSDEAACGKVLLYKYGKAAVGLESQ